MHVQARVVNCKWSRDVKFHARGRGGASERGMAWFQCKREGRMGHVAWVHGVEKKKQKSHFNMRRCSCKWGLGLFRFMQCKIKIK